MAGPTIEVDNSEDKPGAQIKKWERKINLPKYIDT